jgi:hypothetical protein
MGRKRYQIILPLIFGTVSGLLMIWDLHNVRVIEGMGMAWDTGPPVWPYEASRIALVWINAPAYAISAPFLFIFNLRTPVQRYSLVLPSVLMWWWWLGRRIDFGLLPSRSHRQRWRISVSLIVVASILCYIGIQAILDYARSWSEYGHLGSGLLPSIGPTVWCLAIAAALILSAFRVIRFGRPSRQ